MGLGLVHCLHFPTVYHQPQFDNAPDMDTHI